MTFIKDCWRAWLAGLKLGRDAQMIRKCFAGCGREIAECMGFGLARDVIAIQDGTRKIFPRELCGFCAEKAARDKQWFVEMVEATNE